MSASKHRTRKRQVRIFGKTVSSALSAGLDRSEFSEIALLLLDRYRVDDANDQDGDLHFDR